MSKSGSSLSAQAVLGALQESSLILRWGFALLALLYLTSGMTRVAPNENALILRFGKLQPQVHPPGLLFAWPFPIDEVIRVPVRSALEMRLDTWGSPPMDAPEMATLHPIRNGYSLTGDANIIHARLTVRYQIVDPVAAVFSVKEPEPLIEAILYQSVTSVFARTGVDAALTTERDLMRQEIQRLAQTELDELQVGIQLVAVEFRELLPARPVIPAFQEVVSAQVEARTISQQAESYRAEQIPAAEAEAYRIRQEANAVSSDLIARAKGEARSFEVLLQEYQLSPEITRARLRAESWDVIAEQLKTSMVLPASPGQLWLPTTPQTTP